MRDRQYPQLDHSEHKVVVNVDLEKRKLAEFFLADGQRLAGVGSWAFDASGFDYWSPEMFRMHGLDPGGKAPTVQEYMNLVHSEDRGFVRQAIETMLADQRGFDFTKRIVRPDGTIRIVRCVGVPATHGATFLGFVGTGIDVTEQEHLTAELLRREAYLAKAQRLSHTGSFGWNVSTDEHFWSEETFRIFEIAPSLTVSLPMIQERIHPEDMPGVKTAIAAASRGEGIDLEPRLLMSDGRVKHLHVVGEARRLETGSVEIIGAVMDVTARKLTEAELRRSKAHLADAQRLSRTGSVGMEVSTKRIFWSEEAARIYGYPAGTEPTPDLILQRSHPDDLGLLKDTLERAAQGSSDFDFEHRLRMPDGSIKHLRDLSHFSKDEAGNEEIVGAIMDITEHKIAEEKVREQELEFRLILDLAPQLVAVYGPNRERLYANRAVLDYVGLSLEKWQEASINVHPDDIERIDHLFREGLRPGSYQETELRLRKRDGSYRWFLARFNPLKDHLGQLYRWYVTGIDIHDRKQAEEILRRENVALREEIDKASMFEEIVGTSTALRTSLSLISKVAPSNSTVLITGETGTGKELFARAIHRRSNRSARPFISVNCAAIPRDLIASELFGHEKGAFTGATHQRLGRFESADGGTLFLDEVGDLPSETQVALLRVLQEHEFQRVGSPHPIRTDVRVIAATNRDLQAAIRVGSFRSDLFYRLYVFPIDIPPLRQRAEDIPLLVEYFIDRYARRAGKTIERVSKKTLNLLQSYSWPGNIRELQNVIERSVILCETEIFSIDESWLPQQSSPTEGMRQQVELPRRLLAHEKNMIESALGETHGRVSGPKGAAAKLGIPRSTLESKIRLLKINKNRFRTTPVN